MLQPVSSPATRPLSFFSSIIRAFATNEVNRGEEACNAYHRSGSLPDLVGASQLACEVAPAMPMSGRLTKAEVDKQFAPVGDEGLLTCVGICTVVWKVCPSAGRFAGKIHQLEKAVRTDRPIKYFLCTGEFEADCIIRESASTRTDFCCAPQPTAGRPMSCR